MFLTKFELIWLTFAFHEMCNTGSVMSFPTENDHRLMIESSSQCMSCNTGVDFGPCECENKYVCSCGSETCSLMYGYIPKPKISDTVETNQPTILDIIWENVSID